MYGLVYWTNRKWRILAQARWSKKMKPALGIVANINVVCKCAFDFFSGLAVEIRNLPAVVISSHVLKFFLLHWSLGLASNLHATTILIYWTSDRIVIGADSLIVKDGVKVRGCKIIESNGTFLAFDGLTGNQVIGFDANLIATKVFKSNLTLPEKVRAFNAFAWDPLLQTIMWTRSFSEVRIPGHVNNHSGVM